MLSLDGGGLIPTRSRLAAPARSPSTLCDGLVGSESCVRTAAVVLPGMVIVLPFADSAFAAMLSPSASRSPACTT